MDLGALIVKIKAEASGFADAQKKIFETTYSMESLAKSAAKLSITYISLQTAMRATSAVVGKFYEQTKLQAEANARLESAIRSTGMSAGVTSSELETMGQKLMSLTTHSRAAIANVQAIGLNFTNIKGAESMERFTLTVLNMSDALRKNAEQMALTVGKALQDPERGMLSLQRIGLKLPETLRNTVVELYKLGDIAGAQDLIFKHLETRFAYTSEMLAQTLPGAIQQTKNAFNNLFRVAETTAVDDLRQSFLILKQTLSSPELIKDMKAIGGGIAYMASKVVDFATAIIDNRETIAWWISAMNKVRNITTGRFITDGVRDMGKRMYYGKRLEGDLDVPKDTEESDGQRRRIQNRILLAEAVSRISDEEKRLGMIALHTKDEVKQVMNEFKFGELSATSALKEVRTRLQELGKDAIKVGGQYTEAYTVLKNAELSLVNSIKRSGKAGDSEQKKRLAQQKKMVAETIKDINAQMEFYGKKGTTFVPMLSEMLKMFPKMSENWITLYRFRLKLMHDANEEEKKLMEIDFNQKLEYETKLDAFKQKYKDWDSGELSRKSEAHGFGFISAEELIKTARETYKKLKEEFDALPPIQFNGVYTEDAEKRLDKQIKLAGQMTSAYKVLHSTQVNLVSPILSTLSQQYIQNSISIEQLRQGANQLGQEYKDLIPYIEAWIQAQERAKQLTVKTLTTMAQAVRGQLITALNELPENFAKATADFVLNGGSFVDVLQNIGKQIASLIIQMTILRGFSKMFGSGAGSGDSGTAGIFNIITKLFGKFEKGGIFDNAQLTPFASGGIINSPTIFPFANGTGLMGEAGPEAIVPLSRGADGKLGVKSEGGGPKVTNLTVNVNAVDAQSFVQMLRGNKATIESVVIENIFKNGSVRKAIQQGVS